MYFMVNTAKDVLQRELVAQLYREGKRVKRNSLVIWSRRVDFNDFNTLAYVTVPGFCRVAREWTAFP